MSGARHILIAEGAHVSSALLGLQADLATRTDAGATGSGASATITDAAIAATDKGRRVTGTNIPTGAFVGTVVASTSFTLVDGANASLLPSGSVSGIVLGGGYSNTALENWVPQVETKWHTQYDRVTYVLSVIGTTGTAPSSWSLGARFEQFLAHTEGFQDEYPSWGPLQDEQLATCIAEGVGWYGPGGSPPSTAALYGTVASSATVADDASGVLPSGITVPASQDASALRTARVTVSRTVTNQMGGMRVRFQPSITGGDSTTMILLSAVALGYRR